MDKTPGAIDPHRPWIRDHRDDPGAMNWAETLLNPFGETSKLHFSRAWTFMFTGRLMLYLLPSVTAGVIALAGVKTDVLNTPVDLLLFTVPALLLPFAIFTIVTEFTSFIAHLRRLADAQRPTWLAVIVMVPMMLGLAAYAAGTGMGAAQHRALNAPPAARVEAAKEGPSARPAEERRRPPQRRGPAGPPKSERQAAIATGLGLAMPVWWLASSIVMAWSLVWVARLPNGGRGRVCTGSHLTPEEVEAGA
ncbi:MAG: hypothetical protein ACO33A_04485 [Hyphomonas sp.]